MTPAPPSEARKGNDRSRGYLLVWLVVLVTVVVITLVCFGQLALLLETGRPSADTRSRLNASYLAWAFDAIPPINIAALIEDIQEERALFGTPLPGKEQVVRGEFWVPPTPTANPNAPATPTLAVNPPTATPAEPADEPELRATATRQPATATATAQPTVTPAPTNSPTAPFIPPTLTPEPEEERTATPRPSQTPVTPSATPVTPTSTPVPPSATPVTPTAVPPTSTPTNNPVPPSPTPVTPTAVPPTSTPETPVPILAPVYPIAENSGASQWSDEEGGCLAYFGYHNNNPQEVTIPFGPNNSYSETPLRITPPKIEQFAVDRVVGVMEVVWNSGQPFTWTLNGHSATAGWCKP